MLSVRGVYQGGMASPSEPVEGRDGQSVIITFLETESAPEVKTDWDQLDQLLDRSEVRTGISDLAHQHDHYLHSKPKAD